MAIRLDQLNDTELKPLTVKFGNAELNIKYAQDTYTPKFEREMQEKYNTGLVGGPVVAMLLAIVREWDVVQVKPGDEKKSPEKQRLIPVPLTEQTLDEYVAIAAQYKIFQAIQEAQRPNEDSSNESTDTF